MEPTRQNGDDRETSPLLRNEQSQSLTNNEANLDKKSWYEPLTSDVRAHWSNWKIPYTCGLLITCFAFGAFITGPAQLRMLEAAICQKHYSSIGSPLSELPGGIPEKYCKVNPVQEELAMINVWQGVSDSVVGVVFAFPWGILADTKGRKMVAAITFTGLMLSQAWFYVVCYCVEALPPRAVIFGSLFLIIGGGNPAATGIILGLVADACSPDMRGTALFRLQAANLAAVLLGQPIGALMLRHFSYWTPALTGIVIEILSLPLILLIPTVSKMTQRHVAGGEEETRDVQSNDSADDDPSGDKSLHQTLKSHLLSGLQSTRTAFSMLAANRTLVIGLLVLTMTRAGAPITGFLPQFASRRFGWMISEASYISVLQATASMIMLMVILPAIKKWLRVRHDIHGPQGDLKVARYSVPLLAIGCFLLGLAPTPAIFVIALVIYIMGCGFRPSLESLLASAVLPNQIATLYVFISIMDTIGMLISSPILGIGFSKGLNMGGAWIGLPFIAISVLYMVATIMTIPMRSTFSST